MTSVSSRRARRNAISSFSTPPLSSVSPPPSPPRPTPPQSHRHSPELLICPHAQDASVVPLICAGVCPNVLIAHTRRSCANSGKCRQRQRRRRQRRATASKLRIRAGQHTPVPTWRIHRELAQLATRGRRSCAMHALRKRGKVAGERVMGRWASLRGAYHVYTRPNIFYHNPPQRP
jgi:hypothetical protein